MASKQRCTLISSTSTCGKWCIARINALIWDMRCKVGNDWLAKCEGADWVLNANNSSFLAAQKLTVVVSRMRKEVLTDAKRTAIIFVLYIRFSTFPMRGINLNMILAFLGYSSLLHYLVNHIQGFSVGFCAAYVFMLVLRAPISVMQRIFSIGPTLSASFMLFRLVFLSSDTAIYREKALNRAKDAIQSFKVLFQKKTHRKRRAKGTREELNSFYLD